MLHTVLATTGLVICIALAVHMALPRRAQAWVDALVSRLFSGVRGQFRRATNWRRQQRETRAAAMEAERVIRRARESALHDEAGRGMGRQRLPPQELRQAQEASLSRDRRQRLRAV